MGKVVAGATVSLDGYIAGPNESGFEQIARFNREGGADLIAIKIGLHAGACLAVTLNDRLDYFGQTVNIAARVQGLAGPDEILVTDEVFELPGARELVTDLPTEASSVELRGVAGTIEVHRSLG
jgi:class 3 adenylate cyclase